MIDIGNSAHIYFSHVFVETSEVFVTIFRQSQSKSSFLASECEVSERSLIVRMAYDNSMPHKHMTDMSKLSAVVNTVTYGDTRMHIKYRNFSLILSFSNPNINPIDMKFEYVTFQNVCNREQ